ncbi:MAG: hypothetical protein QMD05_10550 [Candidatus Brocadiaceae bacterium]|nr:hypothetical protein [Candidatus Brocadiaceae bacterium]
MTPGKGPICESVRVELKGDVRELFSKVNNVLEMVHEVRTNVALLLDREKPPCIDHVKRIQQLEDTKTFFRGGWRLVMILGGGIVGLCSIGSLIVAIKVLLK